VRDLSRLNSRGTTTHDIRSRKSGEERRGEQFGVPSSTSDPEFSPYFAITEKKTAQMYRTDRARQFHGGAQSGEGGKKGRKKKDHLSPVLAECEKVTRLVCY